MTTSNRYEGGDLLVESLKNLGVGQIFSVSGGVINSIYRAAAARGLALVHNRHEAGAALRCLSLRQQVFDIAEKPGGIRTRDVGSIDPYPG